MSSEELFRQYSDMVTFLAERTVNKAIAVGYKDFKQIKLFWINEYVDILYNTFPTVSDFALWDLDTAVKGIMERGVLVQVNNDIESESEYEPLTLTIQNAPTDWSTNSRRIYY